MATDLKRGLALASLIALIAPANLWAKEYPRPGKAMATPVHQDMLDSDTFEAWVNGKELTPEGWDVAQGPAWLLWTDTGRQTGHSGLAFGTAKVTGPRHLRIGLKEAVPVGTVLTKGNTQVGVLKEGAAYPGNLGNDAEWLQGQRLAGGEITVKQTDRDEFALWVFPAGTTTRALRFTHHAAPADPEYEGWLGGALVLRERLLNLAPLSMAASQSNNRHANKLINGMSDGWGCWENTSMDGAELANEPIISTEHAEWIQLTWTEPVKLDGLIALWSGFGATEIWSYTGPADLHPRDASDADWKVIASPAGFECGYPTILWPNYFPFAEPVQTRALRLWLTAVTPAGHPHVQDKPAGGKRVWLGEVMAVENLGSNALGAPTLAKAEVGGLHAPIAVPFTLPEAGYVTLVLEDQSGMRIRNLVSETWFLAGKNTAWWDGTDDLGRDVDAANHGLYNIPARFVSPGAYTARGLWRKEIGPFFEFAVYGAGDPPWSTPDHTGAWLANHSPPSAAVFVPASHSPTGEPAVFLGCYVTEGPDGMAWVDLDGRKRGGMRWIGGNWTAAPFLCRDVAPAGDPNTSAYVASVWEMDNKSGAEELRVTALERGDGSQLKTRAVYTALVEKRESAAADAQPAREKKRATLGGVAAYNGVVVCTFPDLNRVLSVDAASGKVATESAIDNPRGLAYDATGRLFLLSGIRLLRVEPSDQPLDKAPTKVLVAQGLEDPVAVALDAKGNLYVSDRGKSHQVRVFSPEGKLLRSLGHAGAPKAGPYDPLHMNNPAGLAVDSQNQLWVTEDDFLPKRVSVWSLDGKLIRAFYGPGKYGGGGVLDSHDKSRFYYADESHGALEFKLDWAKGKAQVVAVLCRDTPGSLERPFRSAAPETALYRAGRRYFTNCYNTNPTNGHNTAFVYLERTGVARPVAAMGLANEWPLLKADPFRALWPEGADPDGDRWQNGQANQVLFAWSDLNEDAQVQLAEVALHHFPVRGVTVMDDLSFCIANVGDRAMRFAPTGFSKAGVPIYSFAKGVVLADGVQGPQSTGGCQVLTDGSDEAVITLGVLPFSALSISGTKDGKAAWSYPSLWPGLHASHQGAKPDRPGALVGTTRLLGSFVHPKGSEVGPLWAINGNMGNVYLFTRDGLLVATVFEDVRQGKLWKMAVAQRGMSLKGISLHDENFWPSISQTPEGQVYLVDGANCSLVRLDGLDSLRPIAPVRVEVTARDLAASQQYVVEQEAQRQRTFGSGVLTAAIRATAPTVDGTLDDWTGAGWVEIDRRGDGANFNSDAKPYNILGALAASGDRLYAAWDTGEPKLLTNSGELPNALFKTGGALDLMLGTNLAANPDRREPVAGDLRLLVTQVGQETKATLYRQVAPGALAADKVPFSSPWRTVAFDQVKDVSDQVQLAADGKGHYEISVPLSLLGLQPKPGTKLKGDLGILRGNGTETTARSYWSNKATGSTADVPSEVMLTPNLWGAVEWK
ncbi:MAG: hypothetical protein COZ06_24645 [Armatimonadetes bacterium CG_4_10_14_3_um_filter_66_18]|nr:MAG: hypothetical protein COZ06_24645 [Armatimonadetes bacterium CG_4_10_14_3_um_filter_66_18]